MHNQEQVHKLYPSNFVIIIHNYINEGGGRGGQKPDELMLSLIIMSLIPNCAEEGCVRGTNKEGETAQTGTLGSATQVEEDLNETAPMTLPRNQSSLS